jgi:uncharacterized membrane protein YccC
VGISTFIGLRSAGRATAGTLASVAVVVAAEQPTDLMDALLVSLTFLGGGALTMMLSVAVWPSSASGPARRAVALVFHELRDMAAELAYGLGDPRSHERLQSEHRRSVRDAIERARGQLNKAAAQPGSAEGSELDRALDSGDRMFAGLIALSHAYDHRPSPENTLERDLLRDLDAALAEVPRLILKPRTHRSRLHLTTKRLRAWRSAPEPLVARVTDAWTMALDRLVEAPPIDASLACAEKEPSPGSEPTTGEAAAVSIAAARCSGPRARPSVAPRRGTEIGR